MHILINILVYNPMYRYYLIAWLLVLQLAGLSAQSFVVEGRVFSAEDNSPVIGATVLVEGTGTGSVTDIDGSYRIEVPSAGLSLSFSYLGFQTVTRRVEGAGKLDVVLPLSATLLEEVVVVGYGSQKRSNISGAVATVTADEIASSPVTRIEQALQGRTAGVQVASVSGSPGSPLTVRVRGTGTINNSDPLYIVDGVPVDGIDYLSPGDIVSMNVLKDAAAAAIYGARGGNGVVLITTKSGQQGDSGRITYEASTGFQQAWRLPRLLSAREYAIISNESHVNAGQLPRAELSQPALLGEGTNWLEAIFGNAPMTSHQLSLSNATERSSLMVTGSYLNQDGIVGGEKSGFERYTARLNAQQQIKSWLKTGSSLTLTYLQRNFLPENNEFTTPIVRALNMDPVTPVRKADGTYAYSIYSDTDISNPVNAIEQTYDRWTSQRLVGNVFGEFSPAKGLSFRSAFSVDATFAVRDGFRPRFDLSLDPALGDAPAGERNLVNAVSRENNTWRNWQWENILTYSPELAGPNDLSVTAGSTALYNRFDYSGGANTNLPSNDPDDAYISNTIDPITSQSAYAGAGESALASWFGRVNYARADKYLLTATLRADGSSRFGANNRWGYFPSVSAGWNIGYEDFWPFEWISAMKIRASWGQNGNDRIGNYSFTTVVNTGQNYTFGSTEVITNGSTPLSPANPDIRWETNTQANLGFDAELLDGKLFIVADLYNKRTTDMLYAAPIPLIVGSASPVRNIGSMDNRGFELSASYRQLNKPLTYSISGNLAFVQTEVLSLGEGGKPIFTGRVQSANAFVARTEVGFPIASFYGYVTDGIFQSAEEVAAHAFQSEQTQAGDIRFLDLNGDNVINELDQTWLGNPVPDLTYGLTIDLGWKGFDLNIFLQGVHGNEVYNATTRYDFTYVNRPAAVLNRWTGPGTSNSEPRVSLNDPNQNARVSSRFVEDGSYLRIRNLQLGYSLPKSVCKRLRLHNLRIYAGASNLMTFTRYSGLDPEIGTFFASPLEIGIDKGFYPQARTWIAGINVSL